ncbi:hypothetical protein [Natronorubrum halophilum]|uniref:hypothetical protein n=1 Tax=Natronorubrum halophilum TaxID=1702106 RepID=UPI000EF6C556|nr:hypothetical protein [Natronorubrum halophilum]
MTNIRRTPFSTENPVSFIVLVGLVATIGGLTIRDSAGISTIVAAVGIGLLVTGSTYTLTTGSTLQRLTTSFVALVSVQLVAIAGIVRWLGAVGLLLVLAGICYGRRVRLHRSLARR